MWPNLQSYVDINMRQISSLAVSLAQRDLNSCGARYRMVLFSRCGLGYSCIPRVC